MGLVLSTILCCMIAGYAYYKCKCKLTESENLFKKTVEMKKDIDIKESELNTKEITLYADIDKQKANLLFIEKGIIKDANISKNLYELTKTKEIMISDRINELYDAIAQAEKDGTVVISEVDSEMLTEIREKQKPITYN